VMIIKELFECTIQVMIINELFIKLMINNELFECTIKSDNDFRVG
jgi:hypothetical protein